MRLFDKQTTSVSKNEIQDIIENHAHDLLAGLEPLMDRIGDARIVLLGEASHGTHEYYIWRALITKKLVEEKGFNLIGVEGDWPDCYRINRYIRNYEDSGEKATEVLKKFHRWPTWMWANWEVASLMEWLRKHNQKNKNQVGFYGLDVYSLWESLDAIMDYLRKNDPDALATAQKAYQCFEPYNREGQDYALSTRFAPETCEKEVVDLLREIRSRVPMYDSDPEAPFNTEQNAMVAANAERYYRAMIKGGPESWNIRDRHMTETIEKLLYYGGEESKIIVWEHNTHIGDARATDMHRSGMVNVGQLVREKWGNSSTVSVGFGSYEGSVIAGSSWGAEMEEMNVPKARENSWEDILHSSKPKDKFIISDDVKEYKQIQKRLNHRAIGVVYDPDMEHYGNYVPSLIPERYDAFVFIDKTKALHAMDTREEKLLTPETYPFGV